MYNKIIQDQFSDAFCAYESQTPKSVAQPVTFSTCRSPGLNPCQDTDYPDWVVFAVLLSPGEYQSRSLKWAAAPTHRL
jgi:hypothetical protein